MKNRNLAVFFATFVTVGGLVILLGWLAGIEEFIHPADGFARVKPMIAVIFVVLGLQLLMSGLRTGRRGQFAVLALTGAALFQFIVMASQLLAAIGSIPQGIELTIISPNLDSDFHTDFGPASLGTILMDFCLASIGLLDNFGSRHRQRRILNLTAFLFPVSALIGYAFKMPLLYFFIAGVSSRMAIYTAILGLSAGLSTYFSSPVTGDEEE